MKTFLVHTAVTLVILVAMVWPAFLLAGGMASLGLFGSCFEGGCAYGAMFVGAPVAWVVLSALGIWAWAWLWRRL